MKLFKAFTEQTSYKFLFVNYATKHLGHIAVLAVVVTIFAVLPIGTAIQFGGDEGYQLMIANLMSKGYTLYERIWYDQPPALVLFVSWSFKLFGPSIIIARAIAAAFGLLLVSTFYQVIKTRSGGIAAILGCFFLLASPAVLEISVSIMQEVPAFATTLVSVLLLYQWKRNPRCLWLLTSGAVFGIALEIKYTAALVLPAMFLEILVTAIDCRKSICIKRAISAVLQWSGAITIVLVTITLIWARGGFEHMYRSHFAGNMLRHADWPEGSSLPLSLFYDHAEGVIGSIIGIIFVIKQRGFRKFMFPTVMLLTTLAVHVFHRPWWTYYYLHFAIPVSWLSGFAVSEIIKCCARSFVSQPIDFYSAVTWNKINACIFVSLVLLRSGTRLELAIANLQNRKRVNADPIVSKMIEYAGSTHWVYVPEGEDVYPFHAGLLVPPELADICFKRLWSHQITIKEVVEINKRYNTEQILIRRSRDEYEWSDLLSRQYSVVYQDTTWTLYFSKQAQRAVIGR